MKRLIDVVVAVFALLALLPLMIVIGILVRWQLGGKIFFRQQRPGLHGEPFQLVKFRTMLDEHDVYGRVLHDSERLTRFGRVLRSTSLDELPELWNVLKGEMSLVGPRPLLMEYLDYYSEDQARRHDVRPGITGWAQVNGRNALSWEEKFDLDVWYVANQSVLLDLKILVMTVAQVAKKQGISQQGHATMEKFTGNKM